MNRPYRLLSKLVVIALLLLPCGTAPARAAEGVSWDFVVTIPDLARGIAYVDWTIRGLSGPTQVCADIDGAEEYVDALWQVFPSPGGGRPRQQAIKRGSECWEMVAPANGPLYLRYQYDLGREAGATGNPDYASRQGENFIFNEEGLLLRPDPPLRNAPITVEFRLPEGISIAAPWQRLKGPGWRFRSDSEQHGAGSYVAIGRLAPLGDLKVGNGTVTVTTLAERRRASDDDLRRWVQRSAGMVADFYGELPGGQVLVLLVPVGGDDDPGVFGTVLHRRRPSVVLYFGAEAQGDSFARDWVAPHELFHLGNPQVQHRQSWFIEGFTTYYQDVLRGRSGTRPKETMWSDIADGVRRYCNSQRGASLADESSRLGQVHNYTRVYWGGACLAFQADVAIRQRTGNRSSLDDVMRALRTAGENRPLSESEIVAAVDRAAGRRVLGRELYRKEPVSFDDLFQRLGILPAGGDEVRLVDEAPLSWVRKGIF